MADENLDEHGSAAALVTTDPSGETRAQATRLARLHPASTVLALDPTAHGVHNVAADNDTRGFVTPYGPTLHRSIRQKNDEALKAVPEDGWTRLARQQHEAYIARDGKDPSKPTRRPWGEANDRISERLGDFVRADNLRQLRHLLSEVESDRVPTLEWGSSYLVTSARPTEAELIALAHSEHDRWCALRIARGWRHDSVRAPWFGDRGLERHNSSLHEWDTDIPRKRGGRSVRTVPTASDLIAASGTRWWNVDRGIVPVLEVLAAWGVVLVRPDATDAPASDQRSKQVYAVRVVPRIVV